MTNIDHDALAEIKTIAPIATITPAQVIDQARSPNSALHRFFTWDDCEAAHAYRLIQASKVLRAAIKSIPRDAPPVTRIAAGVSGPPDRTLQPVAASNVDTAGEAAALRRLAGDISELRSEYASMPSMADIFVKFHAIIQERLEILGVRVANRPKDVLSNTLTPKSETQVEHRATAIAAALSPAERKTFLYLPADGGFKTVSGHSMSTLIRQIWRRFPDENTIGLTGPADAELASLGSLGRLIRGRVAKLMAENV